MTLLGTVAMTTEETGLFTFSSSDSDTLRSA